MKATEIIDILFKSKDQIHFFWNFYVIGILALTGWLISLENRASKPLKTVLTMGYLIFMGLNLSGLLNSYGLFEAARADLINTTTNNSRVTAYWQGMDFSNYKFIVYGAHAAIDTGLLVLIWSDRCWQKLRLKKSP